VKGSTSFGATETAPTELLSFVRLFTCPVTESQFEATLILSESAVDRSKEVEIREVGGRSPHNEGLYEAGKALLVESIEVGRDFCKSMITIATGSIPVYLALVGLAVGKEFRPSLGEGIVLVLGPAGFLLSATAFAIGYFPKKSAFSLDMPSEIETARTSTLDKRKLWATIGFGMLLLGIVLAIAGLIYGLTLEVPTKAPATTS